MARDHWTFPPPPCSQPVGRRARIDRLSKKRAGPCRANFGGYARINPFTPDVQHGRVERHRP